MVQLRISRWQNLLAKMMLTFHTNLQAKWLIVVPRVPLSSIATLPPMFQVLDAMKHRLAK
jgi:hypothetical protein